MSKGIPEQAMKDILADSNGTTITSNALDLRTRMEVLKRQVEDYESRSSGVGVAIVSSDHLEEMGGPSTSRDMTGGELLKIRAAADLCRRQSWPTASNLFARDHEEIRPMPVPEAKVDEMELQSLKDTIDAQDVKIRQLEEIVARRTQQVEQLAMSMAGVRQDLFDADSGATLKKLNNLQHHLQSSQRHEKQLETLVSCSESKLAELYALRCALETANTKNRAWQWKNEELEESCDRLRRDYGRAVDMLVGCPGYG